MANYNAVLSAPGWNRKVTIDGNTGGASGSDLEEQEGCAKDGMSLLRSVATLCITYRYRW